MSRFLRATLATTIALAVIAVMPMADADDSDIFVPSKPVKQEAAPPPSIKTVPKTPSTDVLVGTWSSVSHGKVTCGKGTLTFSKGTGGHLRLHANFGVFDSDTVRNVTVVGTSVSFTYDYIDGVGHLVPKSYNGTLNATHSTISGTLSGPWVDGCAFTMTRQ